MVQLHSVRIGRFRGIREGELQGFADVNLLIGRNNSGKSTVAEAITRALGYLSQGQGRDPINRNPSDLWNQIRRNPGLPAPESWYRQEQSHALTIAVAIDGVNCAVNFSMNQAHSVTQGGTIQPDIRARRDHPVMQYALRLTLFRPLDATDQNIENNLWPQILANRRDKALTKALNEIFEMDAEQLQILPDRRLLVLFSDYGLPLDVQGDGARLALRCLIMLAAIQGTLFIMEEPECHQHPGSLERFALAVARRAKEQEVQLLISTHSAECVRSFLKAAQEVSSECAVFHLKLEDGLLGAKRLDAETVETLQATGLDVRYLDLYG
jgi:AAA15 family ATPase/GTPase